MNNKHNLHNILNTNIVSNNQLKEQILELNEKQCSKCSHETECKIHWLCYANFDKDENCTGFSAFRKEI